MARANAPYLRETYISFAQRIHKRRCLTADDIGDIEASLHVGDRYEIGGYYERFGVDRSP